MSKLDTGPYKGVRDLYPEDMVIQNYILGVWRKVAESYGYQEYGGSILESADLYKNKTSDEIVNEQTFAFIDRGGREVVLRPEMTPTLARMVAARRKNLKFPLRWYSMPNLFRYERPQRGRRREHWQLNCDLMGIPEIKAEIEIISLAFAIMEAFGAEQKDFKIKVNDRKSPMKGIRENKRHLTEDQEKRLLRIRDKKDKTTDKEYRDEIANILGENLDIESEESKEIKTLISKLNDEGINNIEFSPNLTRGFDYYTGIVFEVFDTDPSNSRSLFGGGRYDDLLKMFEVEPIPAVGFGMGDITLRDFLETHKLGPYA